MTGTGHTHLTGLSIVSVLILQDNRVTDATDQSIKQHYHTSGCNVLNTISPIFNKEQFCLLF